MELEEMKILWQDVSQELASQKKLTDQIIRDMTQDRYNDKFRTLLTVESFGAVICFLFFLFIAFNFGKLDTWYLQFCGILCAAFYLFFPFIVIRSILNLKNLDIANTSYKETIIKYTVRRRHLLRVERIGLFLCFIMLFTCLPVASKILTGTNLFLGSDIWWWYVPIGVVFLLFFARWGYRSYQSITYSAEMILQEIHT